MSASPFMFLYLLVMGGLSISTPSVVDSTVNQRNHWISLASRGLGAFVNVIRGGAVSRGGWCVFCTARPPGTSRTPPQPHPNIQHVRREQLTAKYSMLLILNS